MPSSGLNIGQGSALFNALGAPSVDVAHYGAKGDGVTDDSNAILAAIATGQNIFLRPGLTYKISKQITIGAGQSVTMSGAVLKMANQVTDTTTTNITTGSSPTVITVTNGAQWAIGQTLTVASGASYDASSHLIIGISGNNLTVGTNFTTAFPTGGTVYQTCVAVLMQGGTQVSGGTIDGNYANWSWGRWGLTGGVTITGLENWIQGVTIQNWWGEGLIDFGTNSRIISNLFNNLNGNGVHLSGANHSVIDGNRISNVNQDPSVGHANGCIILSNTIVDTTIVNNYCNGGITGVGSLDSYADSSGVASNNFIYNMTAAGIDVSSSGQTDVAFRWTFTGNQIHNCPYGIRVAHGSPSLTVTGATNASPIVVTVSTAETLVDGQSVTLWGIGGNTNANGSYFAKVTGYSTTTFGLYFDSALTLPVAGNAAYTSGGSAISMPGNVVISDNQIFDSTTQSIYLYKAQNIVLGDNLCMLSRGLSSPTNILIDDCISVEMRSCVVSGGNYGVYMQSTNSLSQDITIGGTIRLQYTAGVLITNQLIGCRGISIDGCTVSSPSDAQTLSTYVGISTVAGVMVTGNKLNVGKGVPIVCNANNCIVVSNMVHGGTTYSITSSGGSTGNLVAFNQCDLTVNDGNAGTQDANTFVHNYDAVGGAMTTAGGLSVVGTNTTATLQPYGPIASAINLSLNPKGGAGLILHGHLTTGFSVSSVVAGSAAGTGASVAVTPFGENFGLITITTGTGPTAGQLIVMTTHYGWTARPATLLSFGDALSPLLGLYTSWSSSPSNVININSANAPGASTTYTIYYMNFQPG